MIEKNQNSLNHDYEFSVWSLEFFPQISVLVNTKRWIKLKLTACAVIHTHIPSNVPGGTHMVSQF